MSSIYHTLPIAFVPRGPRGDQSEGEDLVLSLLRPAERRALVGREVAGRQEDAVRSLPAAPWKRKKAGPGSRSLPARGSRPGAAGVWAASATALGLWPGSAPWTGSGRSKSPSRCVWGSWGLPRQPPRPSICVIRTEKKKKHNTPQVTRKTTATEGNVVQKKSCLF